MNGDEIYLRHILDAAQKAVVIGQDYERSDLDTDEILGLALVSPHSLQIHKFPGVRWQQHAIDSFMLILM
jgi:hypothetical protein